LAETGNAALGTEEAGNPGSTIADGGGDVGRSDARNALLGNALESASLLFFPSKSVKLNRI